MTIKAPMYALLIFWLRAYGFWLVLLSLCVISQATALNTLLRFDRMAINHGELWLLVSAHLTHLNWQHFGLNMGGLLIVAVFFRRYCTLKAWSVVFVMSALSVGLGLYYFNPEIQRYVGLSGVLHGMFIVGAWFEMKRYPKSGGVLMVLLVAKLIWEQVSGALPGSESMAGGHVVVDAHLYGAIGGAIFLLLHQIIHINNRQ
jgi:rhomboid family GlyGly-CTERM serine protease